jgi:hypothetical protein
MDYGELVDDAYHPQQDYIYSLLVKYFRNPTMTKIKNQNQFSMYACQIYGLLSNEHRYIIAFTHLNNDPVGTMEHLNDIKWINLQTRTLFETMKCNVHTYVPSNDTPLNVGITRKEITKQTSMYLCNTLPLSIVLLHTAKNDSSSYQNEGTIVAALETYETILSFI